MINVNVSCLSGETIAVLDALPTETISALKDNLHDSNIFASIFEVQFLLDGACIDNTTRVEDLNCGADVQLQMIRSCRSAREILFHSPEVALHLAVHYDALQDECRESICSLFVDEEGKARSCRANMEVLIALHQKLSKVEGQSNGLGEFKAALAEFAFKTLREFEATAAQHDSIPPSTPPSLQHVYALVYTFPWLGLEAVQVLLGSNVELFTPGARLTAEKVFSTLVSGYARWPVAALRRLLHQLPPLAVRDGYCDASSPQKKLRKILDEAVLLVKAKYAPTPKKKIVFRGAGLQADTASECFLETPKEVLAAVTRKSYTLHMVDGGFVNLLCQGAPTRKAKCNTVLAAIKQDLAMMLGSIDSSLVLVAVEECPGAYNYLSEDFKMDRQVLYTALAHDFALQQEFVNTASKTEIQQWRWHVDEQQRKRRQ